MSVTSLLIRSSIFSRIGGIVATTNFKLQPSYPPLPLLPLLRRCRTCRVKFPIPNRSFWTTSEHHSVRIKYWLRFWFIVIAVGLKEEANEQTEAGKEDRRGEGRYLSVTQKRDYKCTREAMRCEFGSTMETILVTCFLSLTDAFAKNIVSTITFLSSRNTDFLKQVV